MEAERGEQAEDDVVERQDGQFGGRHASALILLAAAVAVAPWIERRAFVLVYAIAAICWMFLRNATLRTRYVLLIAILLRALLVAPEPGLSGDVYRYLWDGKVLSRGINPYTFAPNDARLRELREPWHQRINHAEIRTIYPPHAQLLFALVHRLFSWRLLIVLADLIAIVLLRERGLAYATFPLVLFEGAWNGHIDALIAPLILFAMLRKSGAALGIAGGLKIIPLAALPALLRESASRWRFALRCALAFLIPFAPFVGGPLMPGMRDYATRWIFNSPAYSLVHAITRDHFLARCVLALFAVAAVLLARRVSTALATFLLLTPTIHPWYWLSVVPAALMERSRWIFFALAAPFSYLLYDGISPLVVFALCYALPLTPFRLSGRASSAAATLPRRFRSRTSGDASPS